MAEREEGERIVGRRELTPEQERQLAEVAESRRGDTEEWDFARPSRIDRGRSPTAVLSVRVPLSQMKELRRIAGREQISLSRLLQNAIDYYIARPRTVQLRFADVERFFVFNVGPGWTDTDGGVRSSHSVRGGPLSSTSALGTPLRAAS
jgi:hypothetical protein